MDDEQEARYLKGRYSYEITINAEEEEVKEEYLMKLKELGLVNNEVKVESITPDWLSLIFESANLALGALALLYTIYRDRKMDKSQITITFPDQNRISISNIKDFEDVLAKLKQIDPRKEEEERIKRK
jgi:hypothetical protein